jgi:MYXO-CTERM domain-containing protein
MRNGHRFESCVVMLGGLSIGLAGCGEPSHPVAPAVDSVGVAHEAVFVNGDFEADAIGTTPPTGWTISSFTNPSITDTRPGPQTLASLNLAGGGYLATHVVGGALESQADPDLGTGASLRFPKYGIRSAVVNYDSPAQPGNNTNVNQMTQTMTTSNADVDPADNKVHIRFALAPVLYSGGHPYNQQPYYYVELDNLTKGTQLFQDFNASAQAGVPWKTVGTIYYTDWSLVDIAPGNAGLAVGDQVKLIVIAGGCSAGGHFGRVYVDGIGTTIPGIYTSATGPGSANAGSDITYVVGYKNGGTATAPATQLNVVIPTNTTYKSNSLPSACSGVAVGATGTLTCSLGALAPGSSGSLTVTVNINAATAAGSIITNGNYSIQATGISALLGPKVLTTVTSGVTYADIAVTKTDGVAAVGFGQAVTYVVQATNAGPGAAGSVTIADTMPAQLTGVTWTCAGSGGGTCSVASGTGNLGGTLALPVGASATYTVQANVISGTGTGTVTNTATATLGGGVVDPDTSNNAAVDTDSIGVLRTLSVTKTNGNGGSVITVPASISCGTSCSSATGSFVNGTAVVLTASPVSGASFTSWGGACTGTSPTCTVTMNSDLSVTAAFTPPPTVNLTTGNNQGAALGTAFATPLQVRVLDSAGAPIAGATVLFSVPSSGASATLSSASATTSLTGYASVTVTANNTAGAYSVVAALSGTPTTGTFSLWNYGAATTVAVSGGSGQSATVGTAFGAPLVVLVRDAASQPVPGVTVGFTAPASGATAALSGATASTGASGTASLTATAGQLLGAYSVTASVGGIGVAATFALANTAGAAASITGGGGGQQLARVGTAFPTPLVVTVKDGFGNAVSGATVTFAGPGSGASASLSSGSATTSASGQASVTATANATVGSYTVAASVAGVSGTVTFALANYGPLVLAPINVTVPPGGTVNFGATGDPTGGYVYAITTNASGGTVGATNGMYTAGPTGGVTDIVSVSNTLVPSATASVTVGPGVSISPTPTAVPPLGTKVFSASGGSGTGFHYALTTNGSGGAVDLTNGTYTAGTTGGGTDVVTVTDSLGNSATATITVGAGISISPSPTSVSPRGTRTFTASGGSGTGTGYAYTLTTNGSGGTVDAATGAYTAGATGSTTDVVTVMDPLGNSATVTISVDAGVSLAPPTSGTPPGGPVTLTASGGSGIGYVYSVTTNLSGATIDASGAYVAGPIGDKVDVVTATDSLGNTATSSITVGPAVTLLASAPGTAPRGTLTFTASGGSGTGYVYGLGHNASGGTIDSTMGVYTAGTSDSVTDTVVVRDSLGNVASVNIPVGAGLSISPASPAVAPRGQVNLVANGGSGTGYAFTIMTNVSGASIDPTTGRFTAGALGASVDVVRVTDSLGNTATVAISVGNGLTLNPTAPSLAPLQSQLFSAVGGSGTGFVFAVSTNGSGAAIDASLGAYRAGTAGNKTDVVTVTDSLGNMASAAVTVGPGLVLSPAVLSLAPLGTQTFSVSGGSGTGYGFVLGTNLSGGAVDPSNGTYVAGVLGGVTDVLTVTDSFGNAVSVNIGVTAALSAPSAMLSASPRGSLTLVVTGGSGPYTFALTTNGSGAKIDTHAGAYVAGAAGGTSDLVTVTDANGATTTIRVNLSAGISLAPSNPSTAPRGPLAFTATGGSGTGYHYSINSNHSGGTIDATTGAYQAGGASNVVDVIQVVDSLGNTASVTVSIGGGLAINPAAPQVAPLATVTFAAAGGSGKGFVYVLTTNASGGSIVAETGVYRAGATSNVADQVTVSDSLGNSTTATISVGGGVLVAPASAKVAPGGSLALSASGGSGTGYVFSLSSNKSGGTVDGSTGAYTAGTISNVTDTVTVTDSLGNTGTATLQVGPGVSIIAPSTTVPPRGALALTASGGSGNYTFTLRANGSGASIVSATGRYLAGPAPGTTDLIEVSDGLGNRDRVQITVGPGIAVTPAAPVAAPGGAVAFVAVGGSGNGYVFALTTNGSGGTIDPRTGAYLAGDGTDTTDTVTVTDSLGNAASVSVVIGNRLTLNPPVSMAAPRATVPLTASGGSGSSYTFSLATNSSGATIDPTSGVYVAGTIANVSDVVKVTDSLGRTATAEIVVGAGVAITPTAATIGPESTVGFNVSGGSGTGYRFALAPGGSGGTIDPARGDYQAGPTGNTSDAITVIDALGNTATATITVGNGLSVSPSSSTVPPRGSLALTASGGTAPYAFSLTTNASGGTIDPSSGAYAAGATPKVTDVVTATDANGVTVTVKIAVGAGITIAPSAPKVAPGATIQLVATGGAGSGYTWRLVDNSGGGAVDAATGLYTAGSKVPIAVAPDVVEVKDKLGNTARISISPASAASVSASGGSSGCSCTTAGAPMSGAGWSLFGALLAGGLLSGRRRRRERARGLRW